MSEIQSSTEAEAAPKQKRIVDDEVYAQINAEHMAWRKLFAGEWKKIRAAGQKRTGDKEPYINKRDY